MSEAHEDSLRRMMGKITVAVLAADRKTLPAAVCDLRDQFVALVTLENYGSKTNQTGTRVPDGEQRNSSAHG